MKINQIINSVDTRNKKLKYHIKLLILSIEQWYERKLLAQDLDIIIEDHIQDNFADIILFNYKLRDIYTPDVVNLNSIKDTALKDITLNAITIFADKLKDIYPIHTSN